MAAVQTRSPSGRKTKITAPTGGYSSGDIVPLRTGVSGWCGIAVADAAATETCVVEYGHQVQVTKNTGTGESFTHGALVYRDASTGVATATATGNDLMGACAEQSAVGTSATTVWVALGSPA